MGIRLVPEMIFHNRISDLGHSPGPKKGTNIVKSPHSNEHGDLLMLMPDT